MADSLKLQLEILTSGGAATVGELQRIQKQIAQTAAEADSIKALASALGVNYDQAKKLAAELGLTPKVAAQAAAELRSLNAVGADAATKYQALAGKMNLTRQQVEGLDNASKNTKPSLAAQGAQLAELAFRYNNVVAAVRNLADTARPAYDLLIASNERLNAQILSSQTNLASATRVSLNGQEVTDPTAKINATRDAIKAALKQVEIDTQQLVGVTSSEVNELFQITLTNAASINNQSKQFPDAIGAATTLTKGWAASLKVVGIPLNQARQEINSILKGQITQDSILAKNLNITNQQVEQWRSQGRLVDELNKRLGVFVAGNAIAARSISGISSNIQDLIERLGRTAGTPFLEPLIDGLAAVEKYLKDNEAAITVFLAQFADLALLTGSTVGDALKPFGETLLGIAKDAGPIALSLLKGMATVFIGLAQVLAPLANVLAQTVKILADFAATDLGGVVVQTAVVVAALSQLTTITAAFAATALPALWAAALQTATVMGSLYTGMMAVAAGEFALAAQTPILMSAFQLLTAEAIALQAALIPLAAAIGLTVLVRTTNDLKDANEALEAYGEQIVATAGGVGRISGELAKFNKIRAENGTLTEEQIKREKQLRAAAQAQAESIETQIKSEKELTNLSKDQTIQRDTNIKVLEAQRKKLNEVTGGLVLQGKELEVLGTTTEQFAKKLASAQVLIKSEGNGDPTQFKEAAKNIIQLTQQQLQLKQISTTIARERLEAIKNNTKVELETQISAKEAIDKLYDGRISKIKELIEAGSLLANSGLEELGKIRDDSTLEPETRRKAGQQIVTIRKEQIAAETAAVATGKAQIELLQAQQRIGEAAAERELTQNKLTEIGKRIEANKTAQENATSSTEKAKLAEEGKQLLIEQDKAQADFEAKERKRAIEEFDFRRNLLKAQRDLGLTDQGTYNSQLRANDIAQNDLALAQQQEALAKLSEADTQGLEAVNAKIAQLQSKRVEILNAYDKAQIERSNQYYEQELGSFEVFKNTKLISETQFAQERATSRIAQADAEIALQRDTLERLGVNDIEGRNAIGAKINELENKKILALDALYQHQNEQIKIAQDKATVLIQQAEIERSTLTQSYANRQLLTIEETERRKLDSTRQSLSQQLDLARKQEQELAKLANQTRTPEVERAYQKEVQAARTATAQIVLKQLENEAQEIERVRNLTIKSLDDQSAARTRSIDAQLSQFETLRANRNRDVLATEAAGNREVNTIERTTKALELQGNLTRARANLTTAINDAAATGTNIEIEQVKQKLQMAKQLEAASGVSGSNSREILELTRQQNELELKAANQKRSALIFEQTQAQLSLKLEQSKNDLTIRRSVIEARIAEIKAQQALVDAQSLASQERQNTLKNVGTAQADLQKAEQLAPGRDRDRAIADAQAKVKLAQESGARTEGNANQGIDLATQQVELTKLNTKSVLDQQQQQTEINRLQQETLNIQQKTALVQLDASNSAHYQADGLARAKVEAQGLAEALGKAQQIANPDFTRQRIQSLNVSPAVAVPSTGNTNDDRVVSEVQKLRTAIESRDPKIVTNVAFAAPDTSQYDSYNKLQRSLARASV
jgi:hypothetical protein